MDLLRRLSKLFNEHAEEANRIVIITKNSSREEIEKYENEIRKKEREKTEIAGKNPPK